MSVTIPLGVVQIIDKNLTVPPGWRVLTYDEGATFKSQLDSIVPEWGIIGFELGKLDGSGYGSKLSQHAGPECGQVFIVQ